MIITLSSLSSSWPFLTSSYQPFSWCLLQKQWHWVGWPLGAWRRTSRKPCWWSGWSWWWWRWWWWWWSWWRRWWWWFQLLQQSSWGRWDVCRGPWRCQRGSAPERWFHDNEKRATRGPDSGKTWYISKLCSLSFSKYAFFQPRFFCLKFLIKNYPFIPTNTVMVAILILRLWFTMENSNWWWLMKDNYHNISCSSVRGDLSNKSNSDTNDGCNPSEIINMIFGTENC